MIFCSNCGKELMDDIKFCPNCKKEILINTINENTLMPDEVYCQSCCAILKKNDTICVKCGIPKSKALSNRREIYCLFCGNIMNSHIKFCPKCGTRQTDGIAKASFVLSFFSFFPVYGIPFGIIALIFGIKGRKTWIRKKMATTGIILSIIGLTVPNIVLLIILAIFGGL